MGHVQHSIDRTSTSRTERTELIRRARTQPRAPLFRCPQANIPPWGALDRWAEPATNWFVQNLGEGARPLLNLVEDVLQCTNTIYTHLFAILGLHSKHVSQMHTILTIYIVFQILAKLKLSSFGKMSQYECACLLDRP